MINTSLKELAAQLAAKKISSVELTQTFLDRIRELNPRLNAFITIDENKSLAQAKAADALIASGKARAAYRHSGGAEGYFLRRGLALHLRLEDAAQFRLTL